MFEARKEFLDDEADQTEENKQEPYVQQATIQVEIKKVKDQEKTAVEFTRKSGNMKLFYEKVKEYLDEMVAFNDN